MNSRNDKRNDYPDAITALPIDVWHIMAKSFFNIVENQKETFSGGQKVVKELVKIANANEMVQHCASSPLHLGSFGPYHARHYLGLIYGQGKGVEIDHKKASYWFSRATETPGSSIMSALNIEVSSNHLPSDQIIQQDLDACYHRWGKRILDFTNKEKASEHTEAIALLQRAGDKGHAGALFYLGEVHQKGNCFIKPDSKLALQFFEKCASLSDVKEESAQTKEARQKGIKALQTLKASEESRLAAEDNRLKKVVTQMKKNKQTSAAFFSTKETGIQLLDLSNKKALAKQDGTKPSGQEVARTSVLLASSASAK